MGGQVASQAHTQAGGLLEGRRVLCLGMHGVPVGTLPWRGLAEAGRPRWGLRPGLPSSQPAPTPLASGPAWPLLF